MWVRAEPREATLHGRTQVILAAAAAALAVAVAVAQVQRVLPERYTTSRRATTEDAWKR
jgi:hypothetical protein